MTFKGRWKALHYRTKISAHLLYYLQFSDKITIIDVHVVIIQILRLSKWLRGVCGTDYQLECIITYMVLYCTGWYLLYTCSRSASRFSDVILSSQPFSLQLPPNSKSIELCEIQGMKIKFQIFSFEKRPRFEKDHRPRRWN